MNVSMKRTLLVFIIGALSTPVGLGADSTTFMTILA